MRAKQLNSLLTEGIQKKNWLMFCLQIKQRNSFYHRFLSWDCIKAKEARDPDRRNKGKSDADKAGGIGRLFVFGKDEKEYIAYVFVLCVVWFFCSTASVYLVAGSGDQEESEAEHEHNGWRCRKKGV